MSFKYKDKLRLKKKLLINLTKINGVVSVTLVGSFWEKNNSKNFSDIDIVIILKKFNQKKYQECLRKIKKINLKEFNLEHLQLLINPTFGPLKFDNQNSLVFHTMIYDIKSHIDHVLKSPFTCYDWERSRNYKGISLKEIFSVGNIQLIDFYASRRGVLHYLKNLEKGFISYQKYEFRNKTYFLKNKKYRINQRHKIEFSYHLCRFLLINYYKFEKQKNSHPNEKNIMLLFRKIFKQKSKTYYQKYKNIRNQKNKKKKNNLSSLNFVKNFSKLFLKFLNKQNKKKVIFIRHGETLYNDGSFLGVGRDPGIIKKKIVSKNIKEIKKNKINNIFTSSLRRAVQTAELFVKNKNYVIDNDLREKNYGKAEGLKYDDMIKLYPNIIKKWNQKKDPRFPQGENDKDLIKRLNRFKKKLISFCQKNNKDELFLVITHNALLRCLIGSSFKLPKFMWHKITINHIDPLNFIIKNNKIIPNLERLKFFNNINQ